MTNDSKTWWQSRTIWFNLVSALVVCGTVLADPSVATDPRLVALGSSLLSAANIVLRIMTTIPVTAD